MGKAVRGGCVGPAGRRIPLLARPDTTDKNKTSYIRAIGHHWEFRWAVPGNLPWYDRYQSEEAASK